MSLILVSKTIEESFVTSGFRYCCINSYMYVVNTLSWDNCDVEMLMSNDNEQA